MANIITRAYKKVTSAVQSQMAKQKAATTPTSPATPTPAKITIIPGINYNPSTGVYTGPGSGGGMSIAPPTNPLIPTPTIVRGGGNYNPSTQTYTDNSGNQYSMSQENARQIGAKVTTAQTLRTENRQNKINELSNKYSTPQQRELIEKLQGKTLNKLPTFPTIKEFPQAYKQNELTKQYGLIEYEEGSEQRNIQEKQITTQEKLRQLTEDLQQKYQPYQTPIEKYVIVKLNKIKTAFKPTIREQQYNQYDIEQQQKSFGELYKTGDIPSIIRKGFLYGGNLFITGTEKLRTDVLGLGKTLPPTTKTKIGEFFGGLAMGGFFSPVFATGTTGTIQEVKQVSKERFELLSEYFSGLEKKIAEQKTLKGQLNILKDIKSKLTTEESKKGFAEFTKILIEKGIIRPQEYNIIPNVVIKTPPKIKEIPIISNIPEMKGAGTLIGGTSQNPILSQNIFFGTGNQAQGQKYILSNQLGNQKYNTLGIELNKQKYDILGNQLQKQKSSQKESEKQINKLISSLSTKQESSQKVQQKTKQELITLLKTNQAMKEEEKQRKKLVTGFRFGQPQLPKPKPPKPKPPIIPPPYQFGKGKVQKYIEDNFGSFEAFGKRFGKEISLGKGTKEQAKGKLSSFLTGTLGASGFLKKLTGEKLRAEETGLLTNIGLRKSKVSPYLIVEKKQYRLKKGGQEVKEIKMFKKTKKKKIL